MITPEELKELYINVSKQVPVSYETLWDLYNERLKENPQAYEEIMDIFIIPKLIHYANEQESVHQANIDWLDSMEYLNAVRKDAEFWDAVLCRWSKAAQEMIDDPQFSHWAPHIQEMQDVFNYNTTFYETIRLIIPVTQGWVEDWRFGVKPDPDLEPLNDEVRARFLSALTEMRNEERFRLFYIEVDEFIEFIDECDDLYDGLWTIKFLMDEE